MVINDKCYFREHSLKLETAITMGNGSYLSKEHNSVLTAIRGLINSNLMDPQVPNPKLNVAEKFHEEILRDWLMGIDFRGSIAGIPNEALSNFKQGRKGDKVRVSINLRGDTYRSNSIGRDNTFHVDMKLFFTRGTKHVNVFGANSGKNPKRQKASF